MKRVYCLYRVSTKGQVDGDDIPMQRIACNEFAGKRPDWEIVQEFCEKGISGFKVSSEKRDAIQTIKSDAAKGLFDVLLVFMFDRLGRREDETPFVVQWFVNHGIEVWSTVEGQQRFDNHVDKLLNYIRFWQASGESEKTSTRIKTRHAQMVQEGMYRGGALPFGYKLVETGALNKKGHPVHDLVVDEAKSFIVRDIFFKMCIEGYGTHRIAKYLFGVYPDANKRWRPASVNEIIRNPIYKGQMRYNGEMLPADERLRIVEDEVFEVANSILHQRAPANSKRRTIPQQTNGASLLTGLLFCGHCGSRMVGTIARESRMLKRTGMISIKERPIYRCYGKDRSAGYCQGQTVYSAIRIESAVLKLVGEIFNKIHEQIPESIAKQTYSQEYQGAKARLDAAVQTKGKLEKQLMNLKSELIKSINGEGNIDQKVISDLIIDTERELEQAAALIQNAKQSSDRIRQQVDTVLKQHKKFLGWEAEFYHASIAVQKMILCGIIERVTVDRTYTITVHLNITAKQFIDGI